MFVQHCAHIVDRLLEQDCGHVVANSSFSEALFERDLAIIAALY